MVVARRPRTSKWRERLITLPLAQVDRQRRHNPGIGLIHQVSPAIVPRIGPVLAQYEPFG